MVAVDGISTNYKQNHKLNPNGDLQEERRIDR